jgi:hypothetical protein
VTSLREDFHLQVQCPCRAHEKKPRRWRQGFFLLPDGGYEGKQESWSRDNFCIGGRRWGVHTDSGRRPPARQEICGDPVEKAAIRRAPPNFWPGFRVRASPARWRRSPKR